MEPTNPFNRPAESYSRNLDLRRAYVDQTAIFLSKTTGVDLTECRLWVIQELQTQMKDPLVCVLERDEEGDRHKKAYPFTQYLDYVVQNRYYIAPTLSVVLPPWVRVSKLANYIKGNLAERNEEKHKQMVAKNQGDSFKANLHKNNQNNKKILNNAISGNHRSEHSHLCDRPTHPILTSCCRIANGVANSHNERFLAGNRHYYSPEVVLNNFASILDLTDFDDVRDAVDFHGLYKPTIADIMTMVVRCSSIYWEGKIGLRNIELFVTGMDEYERAAVLYMGDFYHLRLYNEELVRLWVDRLTARATEIDPNHEAWLGKVDGDIINQVKVIYPDIIGREELDEPKLRDNPEFGKIGTTCRDITQCLDDHRRIIEAFHTTRNIPFLISDFPSSIRKVGVGSDTDSAIFTVQDWVRWYAGNDDINHANIIVAETFGFLISQTTTHNLATMVSNIGVTDPKELFRLSMKNEYLFPVFVLTSRAKHYFANMAVQEGVVFTEYDFERKGVELIASNSPAIIRKDIDATLHYIIDTVTAGEMISIHRILRTVARWEYTIMESIQRGDTEYLKAARVNEEEGYSTENSRFINYEMWQKVFAPEYGACEAPPYSALSFSVTPDSKRKTEQWIASWKDRRAANEMTDWLKSRGKTYVGEMLLPEAIILSVGIPKEILPVVNVRKIVAKAMSPFYLILESLEFYCFDAKQSKLVMDMVTREEAFMLDS